MKHLFKQKLLLAAIAGIALSFIGIAAMKPEERHDQPPAPPPARDFLRTVAGSGLVEPTTENIAIGTPLAGIVENVFVEVGETVVAGDPLFSLDTRQLRADLTVRRSEESAAEARVATNGELLADLQDQLDRIKKLDARRVVSTEEAKRIEFSHRVALARLQESEAELAGSRARSAATQTEIDRSTITAPVDATVLQVKIRKGEFATAGPLTTPLVTIGQTKTLHVRVDIDENDAGRIRPHAAAYARPRGAADTRIRLYFVRYEPFVIPKRSLTGDSVERVDTRVLQCIYSIEPTSHPLFIGQQVDVFIEDETTLAAK